MNYQRILEDRVAEKWREAAQETLIWGWEVNEQADYHGLLIAHRVVSAETIDQTDAIKDVRSEVNVANQLDREITSLCGGRLDCYQGRDKEEAYGVRIWHHAARTALQLVGSQSRLQRTTRVINEINHQIKNQVGQGINELAWTDVTAAAVLSRVKRR